MAERTAMLASATVTTALVAALFAQSSRSLRAEEECISKPNAPAPQGQHWYYRIDHANNRQCWRLEPQGLPVQKSAPQAEKQSTADAAALSAASPRASQRETTGASPSEIARDYQRSCIDRADALARRLEIIGCAIVLASGCRSRHQWRRHNPPAQSMLSP